MRKTLFALSALLAILTVSLGLQIVSSQENCPPCANPDNHYFCGNCTWWVKERAKEASGVDWVPNNLGDAHNWNDNAPAAGLEVGKIPLVGAVAVWERPNPSKPCDYNPNDRQWWEGCGHVAYVEEVQGSAVHSFVVSEMNYQFFGCVNNRSKNNADGAIDFIYPPSDRPVPLWPYHERRVEHQDPIILQWYGNFDLYGLWYNIYYDNGGHDGGIIVDLQEEQYPLHLPHPGVVTWLIWGYDTSGGNEVQADLKVFYAGPCPETGALGTSSLSSAEDYCGADYYPTPVPTSTPFPTIVPTPTNTPVPLATPTIEPRTPTVVSTWTPGPTDTPPSTPTVTGHTATVVPTWTPGPTDTANPTDTPTPGGGIATPTTSGVTVTPVACPEVTVADVMQLAGRWRCQVGNDCYDRAYDLNDDDAINIVDIMMVVARWGESCGD